MYLPCGSTVIITSSSKPYYSTYSMMYPRCEVSFDSTRFLALTQILYLQQKPNAFSDGTGKSQTYSRLISVDVSLSFIWISSSLDGQQSKLAGQTNCFKQGFQKLAEVAQYVDFAQFVQYVDFSHSCWLGSQHAPSLKSLSNRHMRPPCWQHVPQSK